MSSLSKKIYQTLKENTRDHMGGACEHRVLTVSLQKMTDLIVKSIEEANPKSNSEKLLEEIKKQGFEIYSESAIIGMPIDKSFYSADFNSAKYNYNLAFYTEGRNSEEVFKRVLEKIKGWKETNKIKD